MAQPNRFALKAGLALGCLGLLCLASAHSRLAGVALLAGALILCLAALRPGPLLVPRLQRGSDTRLKLVARQATGPGCQLLLVDCDGQTFFVVQGQGVAEIRQTKGEDSAVPSVPRSSPLFSVTPGKVLWS